MGEHGSGIRVVARVLILNEAGELLLCRSRSGLSWVPPGGTLELGETLTEAAVREAVEEAGVGAAVQRMVYLQEFRPAGRDEHVVEVAFLAAATQAHPAGDRPANPAGPPDRPWQAWFIQDVDGPRREVRWFSRAALEAVGEAVHPEYLRRRFWAEEHTGPNPHLGLVQVK